MKYSLIALCPEELKDSVSRELKSLGAEAITASYKAVYFEVTEENFYKVHLRLRTASTIIQMIKKYGNVSVRGTFNLSNKISWSELFSSHKTFRIDANITERGTDFPSSNELSKQVRLSIEAHFKKNNLQVPKVSLNDPQVIITVFYSKGTLVFGFNTARTSLHKRGYRLEGHPAPLKETMASALIDLMGYDGSQVFLDPMCGSGTLCIEACYLAMNKAAQIHRKKGAFGFEHLKSFNSLLWRKLQDEAREAKKDSPTQKIFASDLSDAYIQLAQKNALRARVEKHIDFKTVSFFELEKPSDQGIALINLPYGERLGKKEEFLEFYKKIGDHLKKNFTGWKIGLFVSEESPWKFIGLHPSRKIPLLNGSIKTKLLIFDIYEGTKKKIKA